MPTLRQFGKRLDGIFGRRTSQREEASIAIALFTIDQSRVVVLADVSKSGAKLQGPALPTNGREVRLRLGPFDAFGRVIWNSTDQCGITFDEPIKDDQLRQLLKEVRLQPVHVTDRRRVYGLG